MNIFTFLLYKSIYLVIYGCARNNDLVYLHQQHVSSNSTDLKLKCTSKRKLS